MDNYYFIAISPPDPLYAQVVNFQMGKACRLVEPHITLKAQGGLVDPPTWAEIVRSICIVTPPFPVEVGGVHSFNKDVIYIDVASPGILSLHHVLLNALRPTEEEILRDHEMEGYVPHLTLAQNIPGWDIDNFEDVLHEAEARFTNFSKFQCRSVKIYRSAAPHGQYRVFKEYKLGEECRH